MVNDCLDKETIEELKIRLGYQSETARLENEKQKIKLLEMKS